MASSSSLPGLFYEIRKLMWETRCHQIPTITENPHEEHTNAFEASCHGPVSERNRILSLSCSHHLRTRHPVYHMIVNLQNQIIDPGTYIDLSIYAFKTSHKRLTSYG